MTQTTIERAYALASAGRVPSIAQLNDRLKAEGFRAVDALLAPRSIRGHLEAIYAATYRAPAPAERSLEPAE
jgi:hypothetical protein